MVLTEGRASKSQSVHFFVVLHIPVVVVTLLNSASDSCFPIAAYLL